MIVATYNYIYVAIMLTWKCYLYFGDLFKEQNEDMGQDKQTKKYKNIIKS